MSRDENLGRRIIGSFTLGVFVALVNYVLDISFIRLGVLPTTTALNDLIIGAAAGSLSYIWVTRQAGKHALELSKEKSLQEAVHDERKRLALELHDTVCQAHTVAIMHLECASSSLGDNPAAQEHLHRALQLVRVSTTEMRCALWDLFPEELQRADIKTALESVVRDLTADNGLKVEFSVDGIIRRLPHEAEKCLLRVSQEALSNVLKHAQAHEVRIDLFLDSQRARLCVKDNGQGFNPDLNPASFGLASMRDRTQSLGGVCTIHSEPGHGTEVHASIPIPSAIT